MQLLKKIFFVAAVLAIFLPMASRAGRVERNVTYGRAGDVELKMDIYFPPNATGNTPVVMFVHGGSWMVGDKSNPMPLQLLPKLLNHGYVVAAINYRFAPEYKFPAQIEDAKCAVRFLHAHAKTLGIDPNRIGVCGDSAGGQLVALLGLTDSSAGFDGQDGCSNQSSRVAAVVDMFGPVDLPMFDIQSNEHYRAIVEKVFGADSDDNPALKRASPVNYISKNAPPFLILQGDHDLFVPLQQSQELDEKLKAAGVSSTLIVVKNAGHGFGQVGAESISPSRAELGDMVVKFFDRTLRK